MVEYIGSGLLCINKILESINIPNLKKIGEDFLTYNANPTVEAFIREVLFKKKVCIAGDRL